MLLVSCTLSFLTQQNNVITIGYCNEMVVYKYKWCDRTGEGAAAYDEFPCICWEWARLVWWGAKSKKWFRSFTPQSILLRCIDNFQRFMGRL
jgi:hypothetical protein